jgi:hypothetical protein
MSAGYRVWLSRLGFVLSAAAAALALRLAVDEPVAGMLGLGAVTVLVLLRWWSRRRTRRLLRSGDVETILRRWSSSFGRIAHPRTMAPLMTATAFAAYGWIERARAVLRSAERGPAWDAALEHRLFLDSMLLTFEGDSDEALAKARALESLPLPAVAPFLVERVRMLRHAVAALARAFSHQARADDRTIMMAASDASPLVHWAMRYGAAIAAVDSGDHLAARALLADAPSWPRQSCFHGFHAEITAELDRRETGLGSGE